MVLQKQKKKKTRREIWLCPSCNMRKKDKIYDTTPEPSEDSGEQS